MTNKKQKIKQLMSLGIQRTYSSWNKLSIEEINKVIQDGKKLKILK